MVNAETTVAVVKVLVEVPMGAMVDVIANIIVDTSLNGAKTSTEMQLLITSWSTALTGKTGTQTSPHQMKLMVV